MEPSYDIKSCLLGRCPSLEFLLWPKTPTINTKIFAIQKKSCEELIEQKLQKYFPALIQNLATLVWFLCNIHAATNSRKNYKKNTNKKKTGGELICKHFGVNGSQSAGNIINDRMSNDVFAFETSTLGIASCWPANLLFKVGDFLILSVPKSRDLCGCGGDFHRSPNKLRDQTSLANGNFLCN